MAQRVIYFDLDGTLWSSDAKRFSCMQPAWDRLPKAVEKAGLKLPDDFDWKKLAGSTDLGVVHELVRQVTSLKGLDAISLEKRILSLMGEYYLQNRQDISSAVFPDTVPALRKFKEMGYKLGVVTGNERKVAMAKLEDSGLIEFFDDESLFFCGDESPNRWELLDRAFIKTMIINKDERYNEPLIYVADTLRDLKEGIESHFQQYGAFKEIRILIRAWNLNLDREDFPAIPSFNPHAFRLKFFGKLTDFEVMSFIREDALFLSASESRGGRTLRKEV